MQLPSRIWTADRPVRRTAAEDWVAARLAWETSMIGRRAPRRPVRIPLPTPAR